MSSEEIKDLINKTLTINTNDPGVMEAIDLLSLDLCSPDNYHTFGPYYPHRPNNIDDMINELNSPSILNLMKYGSHISTFTKNMQFNNKAIDALRTAIRQKLAVQNQNDGESTNEATENTQTSNEATKEDSLTDETIDEILNNYEPTEDIVLENYAVIEFADDNTMGDKIEYELYVLPGDVIDSHTIIGKVMQHGQMKPIRSIFEHAVVMANDDNTFFRLFPDAHADRHIVLTDFTFGAGHDLDLDELDYFSDLFNQNTFLFNLIFNNICYSTLPLILQKRETYSEHHILAPFTGLYIPHICFEKNGQEIYTNYIQRFEETIEHMEDEIKAICSEEIIKQTNGDEKALKVVFDNMLNKKEQLLAWSIAFYQEAATLSKCKYDDNFSDCRYLAQGTGGNGALNTKDMKRTKIGATEYSNYYVQLLARINVYENDIWSKKYFNLLSEIIANRLQKEVYSMAYLISEFNLLFWQNIAPYIANPYELINLTFAHKEDCTLDDILGWITNIIKDTISPDIKIYKKSKQYLVVSAVSQLANIYWFIKNYKGPDSLSMAQNSESWDILALIREEWTKLNNFWLEAIAAYYKTDINKTIDELTAYARQNDIYAEWPKETNIPIEGVTYKLYEFDHLPEPIDDRVDVDASEVNFNPNPVIPSIESLEIPAEAPPNYAVLPSGNDPKKGEITIKDYAYWVRYFSLATVISVPFLADGFDIPTPGGLVPVPLPCIFICLAAIYIPMLDLVLVIGLGLRGIWPAPILLGVNLSSRYLSALVPLVILLNKIRTMFYWAIEKIEMFVPNIISVLIDRMEQENIELRKKNIEYQVYIDTLKAQPFDGKGLLKKIVLQSVTNNPGLRLVYARVEDLRLSSVTAFDAVKAPL